MKVTALWDAMPNGLFYSHRHFRVTSKMKEATNSAKTLENSTIPSFVNIKDTFFFTFDRALVRLTFYQLINSTATRRS
jgi:hypothetical protein